MNFDVLGPAAAGAAFAIVATQGETPLESILVGGAAGLFVALFVKAALFQPAPPVALTQKLFLAPQDDKNHLTDPVLAIGNQPLNAHQVARGVTFVESNGIVTQSSNIALKELVATRNVPLTLN